MKFNELNLKPWINQELDKLNFTTLTEVQEKTIFPIMDGGSLVVTAPTGTGKTLCYLLPILNKIDFNKQQVQVVVLLPTKELARQVESKFRLFKEFNPNLKIGLLMGNLDFSKQIQSLRSNLPHIIITTPTRFLDVLKQKAINFDFKTIVLDEADMLIDFGFINDINNIFNIVNPEKLQKLAFSATLHSSLANQLAKYFANAKTITTSESIWVNKNINHFVVYTSDNKEPLKTLFGLIQNLNPYFCIIFANTKKEVEEIYQIMLSQNKNVAILHKDLSTRERKNVYRDLNNNQYQYLVATDLASRGLDIDGASHVISYDLPKEYLWYIHRAGRVGRYKSIGNSYVVYRPSDDAKLNYLKTKDIDWKFYFLNDKNELVLKPLKLKVQHKRRFDLATNSEIRKIINQGSKKVTPGYKKKIKEKINKIKQKNKRAYIEKQVKQQLIKKYIKESKSRE